MMNYRAQFAVVGAALDHAEDSRERLIERYKPGDRPGLPSNDPRVLTATHIAAGIQTSFVAFLLGEELLDRNWWHRQNLGANWLRMQEHVDNFAAFATIGLIFNPVMLYEVGLRSLVRLMDPAACSGGNAEFASIRQWLFSRLRESGWSWPEVDQFHDLVATIRNMHHNNFSFYPKNGEDLEINWKEKTYTFTVGAHPVGMLSLPFYASLLRELVDINESVMTAPLIQALAPAP